HAGSSPGIVVIAMLLVCPILAGDQSSVVPRPEHPRPDLVRADSQTLNGRWEFEFDDADHGLAEHWYRESKPFSKTIQVPYPFQSKLSGVADTSFHDVVWYRRT